MRLVRGSEVRVTESEVRMAQSKGVVVGAEGV